MSPRSFSRPARHFMRESLVDTRLVFQIGVDENVNVYGKTPTSSRPNGETADEHKFRALSVEFTAKRDEILHRGIARDQFAGFGIEWAISHWWASSWDLNL